MSAHDKRLDAFDCQRQFITACASEVEGFTEEPAVVDGELHHLLTVDADDEFMLSDADRQLELLVHLERKRSEISLDCIVWWTEIQEKFRNFPKNIFQLLPIIVR